MPTPEPGVGLRHDGSTFWVLTDLRAPLRRVIAIDVEHPDRSQWRELVPQTDQVIRSVSAVGDRFLVAYLKDAATQVRVFDLSGRFEREVTLPAVGDGSGFAGRRKDGETFYQFTNYLTPSTVYRYEIGSGRSTVFRQPKVDFDPQAYETKPVFYHSKDGTRVPMFITHRKGLTLRGNNPTLMYAYGGFDIPVTPSFSLEAVLTPPEDARSPGHALGTGPWAPRGVGLGQCAAWPVHPREVG